MSGSRDPLGQLKIQANTYITPSPHTAFSWNFFNNITFSAVTEVDFPLIARPGITKNFTFEPEVPLTAASMVILANETIPNIADITPILSRLEAEYIKGNRSVRIRFSPAGETGLFHFSKIRLFSIINNHYTPFKAAQKLVEVISQLELPENGVSNFLNMKITQPICGFYGEEWLADDVLNALLELLCLRKSAIETSVTRSSLFLPIHFLQTVQRAFESRQYTPEILSLQEHVWVLKSFTLYFLHCASGHYTAYIFQSTNSTLWFRDSLAHHFDLAIKKLLDWILADITSLLFVEAGLIAQQPPDGVGSGSCGVAAFNFIERQCIPDVISWSPSNSDQVRCSMLQDLIRYHLIAAETTGELTDWITTIPSVCENHGVNLSVYNYVDCNAIVPNNQHPIHRFLESRVTQSPIRVPFVDKLPSNSLLPPISLSTPPPPSSGHIDLSSSDDEVIIREDLTSTERSRFKRKSTLLSSPTISPLHHRKQLNLNQSPTTAIKRRSPSVELISRPNDNHEVISLITPVSSPAKTVKKHHESPELVLLSPGNLKAEMDGIKLEGSQRAPVSTTGCGPITVGCIFQTLEEACDAVYQEEERRGHKWIIGQTKICKDNPHQIAKQTLRCNHRGVHVPIHGKTIDPSDFRQGKSIKTDCKAHVNVIYDGIGLW
ncbi:hypothetical protein VKT23_020284 [Stygiomarasmius scandens]|uniref:Ubiquitin-like protease family profile domain-containing protein n=1 Tax=Marasmiellus scandens TaxID=2682957 RepID=A0ABR1IN74_9AGAR